MSTSRWSPSATWTRTRSRRASTATKTLRCVGPGSRRGWEFGPAQGLPTTHMAHLQDATLGPGGCQSWQMQPLDSGGLCTPVSLLKSPDYRSRSPCHSPWAGSVAAVGWRGGCVVRGLRWPMPSVVPAVGAGGTRSSTHSLSCLRKGPSPGCLSYTSEPPGHPSSSV